MHYPEDEDSEGEGMSDEDEDEGSEKNEEEQGSENKEDTEGSENKRSRHRPQHAARPLPDHAARASTANTASKDAFALETLTTRLYGVSHAGASIKHVWSAVGSAVGSRMAAWFPSAPSTSSHHHPVPTLSPSSPHPNGVACDATPEPAAVFQVEAALNNQAGESFVNLVTHLVIVQRYSSCSSSYTSYSSSFLFPASTSSLLAFSASLCLFCSHSSATKKMGILEKIAEIEAEVGFCVFELENVSVA
jgi:hypothetical protein